MAVASLGTLLSLQVLCPAVLVLAFLAARRSRHSLWVFLMGGALVGVVIFGLLAFIGPLFG